MYDLDYDDYEDEDQTVRPEKMTFSELRQRHPNFTWKFKRLSASELSVYGSDFDYQMELARYVGAAGTGSFIWSYIDADVSTAGGKVRVIEYQDNWEDYSW